MILAPWNGEGSLDPQTAASVAAAEREGWAALRSLQGDPLLDVLRYALSGGDPSRGVPAGRTLVPGLSAVPALRGEVTEEEALLRGVVYAAGTVAFELFTDVDVLLTDLLRFPSGGGAACAFAVIRVQCDANIGQTIVWARPAVSP